MVRELLCTQLGSLQQHQLFWQAPFLKWRATSKILAKALTDSLQGWRSLNNGGANKWSANIDKRNTTVGCIDCLLLGRILGTNNYVAYSYISFPINRAVQKQIMHHWTLKLWIHLSPPHPHTHTQAVPCNWGPDTQPQSMDLQCPHSNTLPGNVRIKMPHTRYMRDTQLWHTLSMTNKPGVHFCLSLQEWNSTKLQHLLYDLRGVEWVRGSFLFRLVLGKT